MLCEVALSRSPLFLFRIPIRLWIDQENGAQKLKNRHLAYRTFGLDTRSSGSDAVNLNVLYGGRAVVQVAKNE